MPAKVFKVGKKYILIPILISDNIRKELCKRIEEIILAQAKLLQGGTLKEDVKLDPLDFKSSAKPAVISRRDQDVIIESMYTRVDGDGLSNLLKADIHQSGKSKISRLFTSFRDIFYRRVLTKLLPEHSKADVIWKEPFSHVVFDKSDIEKVGLTLPISQRLIISLQKRGWKNFVVYDAEEQKLHFYTVTRPYDYDEQL